MCERPAAGGGRLFAAQHPRVDREVESQTGAAERGAGGRAGKTRCRDAGSAGGLPAAANGQEQVDLGQHGWREAVGGKGEQLTAGLGEHCSRKPGDYGRDVDNENEAS